MAINFFGAISAKNVQFGNDRWLPLVNFFWLLIGECILEKFPGHFLPETGVRMVEYQTHAA
jgi:hypothetical protein